MKISSINVINTQIFLGSSLMFPLSSSMLSFFKYSRDHSNVNTSGLTFKISVVKLKNLKPNLIFFYCALIDLAVWGIIDRETCTVYNTSVEISKAITGKMFLLTFSSWVQQTKHEIKEIVLQIKFDFPQQKRFRKNNALKIHI